MMRLYPLRSAAAILDEAGDVYPMLADGQPDWARPLELTRTTAVDWWEGLDADDRMVALDVWHDQRKIWWEPLFAQDDEEEA